MFIICTVSSKAHRRLQMELPHVFSCNSKKSDSTHTEFVKNYVRCHGINKDGKRCNNQAQVKQRQTLYIKFMKSKQNKYS